MNNLLSLFVSIYGFLFKSYCIQSCDWSDFLLLLYLHEFVTVCKVVDDGERLLEARAAGQRHVGDQLTHSDDDLDRKQRSTVRG